MSARRRRPVVRGVRTTLHASCRGLVRELKAQSVGAGVAEPATPFVVLPSAASAMGTVGDKLRKDVRKWTRATTRKHLRSILANDPDPAWAAGKLLEYALLRAFELDGLRVLEWPYEVKIEGTTAEQIDGAIAVDGMRFLIECKDYDKGLNIHPIYSLRERVLRRPPGTMGIVVANGFTGPAKVLARHATPLCVLLWPVPQVVEAFERKEMRAALERRYHYAVTHGFPDFDDPDLEASLSL